MCALHKIIPFFFFSLLLLGGSPWSQAQVPEKVSSRNLSDADREVITKISALEERLKQMETSQKEILAQEEKILAEINRLRYWIHNR